MESAYRIEHSSREEQWLEYWTNQETEDPETGLMVPVIDKKKAAELMEIAGDRNYIDEKSLSLRRQMREAVQLANPRTAGKPLKAPRKRFMIDDRERIAAGKLAIEVFREES